MKETEARGRDKEEEQRDLLELDDANDADQDEEEQPGLEEGAIADQSEEEGEEEGEADDLGVAAEDVRAMEENQRETRCDGRDGQRNANYFSPIAEEEGSCDEDDEAGETEEEALPLN